IHGCIEELKALLALIKADLKNNPIAKHRIIFVGDYVDRGPDSHAVIELMLKLKKKGKPVTFLCGNHEEKLLRACREPDERSLPGFIRYGGLQTLESYGLRSQEFLATLGKNPNKDAFKKLAKLTKKHVGKAHYGFLEQLETHTQEGDYFFCHAGVDPKRKLKKQEAEDLIWMREPFLSWNKPLEKVVVHGHTPHKRPELLPHRINVDTACVYGATLTSLVLEASKQRFLSVPAARNYRKEAGL
ncbi:MAG: metallophosphoesterase, partial [Rhizobiaceae bacterium]